VCLETHVVRRCKALQVAAWQRHARFEATQQVRSNCVFQVQHWWARPAEPEIGGTKYVHTPVTDHLGAVTAVQLRKATID
jgi:hypothetical protein